MSAQAVTITMICTPPRKFWSGDTRWKPWRWLAYDAADKIVASSSDFFTTREECVASINKLFGPDAEILLADRPGDPYPLTLRRVRV